MNQKTENELNLALFLPNEERTKTSDLDTGYSPELNRWELIVRYNGDIDSIASSLDIAVKKLSEGYALVEIEESKIDEFSMSEEIIYIEKPKKLFFELDFSISASCISQVESAPYNLSGEGIIVAVIDSGIDYTHPDFINPDGTTRIIELYDENLQRTFSREQINEALQAGNRAYELVPSRDVSGHGTHVAGIAAGNGRASNGRYRGVAYRADLLIVKLGNDEFFTTARLMEAVDYVIDKSASLGMPVAINLSFGNNYGSHDGTSLVETYLDAVAGRWKTVIAVGTGNEASKRVHTQSVLSNEIQRRELIVGAYEASIDIQLWKSYSDAFLLSIITPSGKIIGPLIYGNTITSYTDKNTKIYVYYGEPSPFSQYQEIFIQLISINDYIDSGVWQFVFEPQSIKDGRYDMWLPAGSFVSRDTGFTDEIAYTTLTIPSTSYSVISVGAYNARTNSYVDFSGRGYTRAVKVVKPELAAPGVDIQAPSPGGGYVARTGTSMATPFVAGSAALLMEWGIVRGNDRFLYGEKVKAFLIRGARQLAGLESPNPMTGWGVLCVRDSLP